MTNSLGEFDLKDAAGNALHAGTFNAAGIQTFNSLAGGLASSAINFSFTGNATLNVARLGGSEVLETLERKFGSDFLPDLVIGGFHLMKHTEFSEADTAEVTEIANSLKGYKAHFATCHCTGLPVYTQMKEIMGEQLSYVRSGDEVLIE